MATDPTLGTNTLLARIVDGLLSGSAVEAVLQSILALLQAPQSAVGWSDRITDAIADGTWETVALDIEEDSATLSLLTFEIGTIGTLTGLDWYLSWESDGGEPITGVYSWVKDTELKLGKGTLYVGAARLDIDLTRFAGFGTTETIYLHHKGTGDTPTMVVNASGSL